MKTFFYFLNHVILDILSFFVHHSIYDTVILLEYEFISLKPFDIPLHK